MTKMWCMRGFSGSGKSTRAAEIAEENGAAIVCRDDLRKMLLGSYWTGRSEDEDRVTVAEEAQVIALLKSGAPVIVDATHLHPPYLRRWARLATRMGVEFEVVDCRQDVTWCVSADLSRQCAGERYVGPKVIHDQARRFPMHKWPTVTAEPFTVEPVEWVEGLPEAIIVDIDGTLAHIFDPDGKGRSPYDYTRVEEDLPDEVIQAIVADWWCRGDVLVVSGRDDSCYVNTVQWLKEHDVWYDQLLMRPANAKDERGNKLPDYMVKYQLFNDFIRGQYNVRFVLDDRQQVVDMWRQLGLKVLQVAEGNF